MIKFQFYMFIFLQIGLSEQHLSRVGRACLPYLSTSQPAALQETCLEAFREFILLEPGSVWLLLIETYCSSLPQPPHPCFKPLKVIFTPSPHTLRRQTPLGRQTPHPPPIRSAGGRYASYWNAYLLLRVLPKGLEIHPEIRFR